jgi:hypothetical protein
VGQPRDENQIAGHARSGLSGALPDPGSTPGASTKPNDLAEGVGRRTRVFFPCPDWTIAGSKEPNVGPVHCIVVATRDSVMRRRRDRRVLRAGVVALALLGGGAILTRSAWPRPPGARGPDLQVQ